MKPNLKGEKSIASDQISYEPSIVHKDSSKKALNSDVVEKQKRSLLLKCIPFNESIQILEHDHNSNSP